jgi:hypothetical protein
MDELHSTVDKACAILRRTNDGDGLDPDDLYLTECAVNGFLTETGRKKFDGLHRRVVAGEYKKPWFHGVEPMTRDHEGYIYYKNMQTEHYDNRYAHSLQAARDLTELRNRCVFLERRGVEITCVNVVWGWERYATEYGAEKRAELDALLDGGGLTFSKIIINENRDDEIDFFAPGVPSWEDIREGPELRDFRARRDCDRDFEVFIQSYRCGDGDRPCGADAMTVIPSCFGFLNAGGFLEKVHSRVFSIMPEHENGAGPEDEFSDEDEQEAGL